MPGQAGRDGVREAGQRDEADRRRHVVDLEQPVEVGVSPVGRGERGAQRRDDPGGMGAPRREQLVRIRDARR